ncbi:MAG: rod shape-determining protein RodA [Calditerrivibrio sp.]|nr:rod shape-determining protein RodA [Calditerrivibrio sp.]MCA1932307.1 rod shape-determining protein RodA [Calditerrivibrio sp.]MCA1980980.1 rod shape-determining protein RodA [Calditerrivibrio sp.]
MLQIDKRLLKNFDIYLTSIVAIILLYGWFAVYSASYDPTESRFNSFYIKQLYWLIIGSSFYIFFSFFNYKHLIKWSVILYLMGILMLILVLAIGHIGMGAQRWINIGGFKFQPSEFFKVIFILIMPKIYNDFEPVPLGLVDVVKKFFLVIPPFLLVFLQPDLGTAMVFLAVWGMLLLFRGIRIRTLLIFVVLGIFIAPVVWSKLHDYQKDRILTFISPERDPYGAGYHLIQSKIAVGSGGLLGKGFMKGTQSHLKFLPERHTDFIFSLINEEFGLMGGLFMVVLFGALIFRICYIAMKTKELSGKIVALAVASIVFFQFFVNSGMTLGLLPVVGIPMPLVSYGGSALVTFMTLLGIVNSISIRKFDSPGDNR